MVHRNRSIAFCGDKVKTQQTTCNEKVKIIQNDVVCKNARAGFPQVKTKMACNNTLEKYYPHPEGTRCGKRPKSKYLVNMYGDSNILLCQKMKLKRKQCGETEPQLMRYSHKTDIDEVNMHDNNKRTHFNPYAIFTSFSDKCSKLNNREKYQCNQPCNMHENKKPCLNEKVICTSDKCSKKLGNGEINQSNKTCRCLGKILFMDTRAQTEGLTNGGCLKNKHIMTESDKRCRRIKFASTAKCFANGDDKDMSKSETNPDDSAKVDHIICGEEGICNKASHDDQKGYSCSCVSECSNDTCHSQNKIKCLCYKYYQKFLSKEERKVLKEKEKEEKKKEKEEEKKEKAELKKRKGKNVPIEVLRSTKVDICAKGVCKHAIKNRWEKFMCKCTNTSKPRTKTECSNASCQETILRSVMSQTFTLQKKDYDVKPCDKTCTKSCLKEKLFNMVNMGPQNQTTETFEPVTNIKPRDAQDQTGEPFMEIKVKAIDMNVLNTEEIRNRVKDLSKTFKGSTCVCRTHDKNREDYLKRTLCRKGVCRKTFRKNKKTNFNCTCPMEKCSDLTCDGQDRYPKPSFSDYKRIPSPAPLLEVQVKPEIGRLHFLNGVKLKKNIIKIEKKNRLDSKKMAELDCKGGQCKIARKKNRRNRFSCLCVDKKQRIDVSQCTQESCNPRSALCVWVSKLLSNSDSNNDIKRCKPGDVSVNTKEIRKKKSIYSCICDRFKCTPECAEPIETNCSEIENECSPKPKIRCLPVPKIRCSPKPKIQCSPEPKIQCSPKPKIQCSPEPKIRCSPEPKIQCSPEPKIQCSPKPKIRCSPEPKIRCSPPPKIQCSPPPKIQCSPPPKIQCSPYGITLKLNKNHPETCTCQLLHKNHPDTCTCKVCKKPPKPCKCNKKHPDTCEMLAENHPDTCTCKVCKKPPKPCKCNKKHLDTCEMLAEKHPDTCEMLTKNHPESCSCKLCKAKNEVKCKYTKRKFFVCTTVSSLFNRQRYSVNKNNCHKRCSLVLPPQKCCYTERPYETANFSQVAAIPEHPEHPEDPGRPERKKNPNHTCLCVRDCECEQVMEKERLKRKKKGGMDAAQKEMSTADKEFQKEQNRKEIEAGKARIKQMKIEQKEMKELSKQDVAGDTNCLADTILGILRIAFLIVKGALSILMSIIKSPEASYRYARQRFNDPKGTLNLLQKWFEKWWLHQKFRMNRTIKGSQTMTILVDEVKESDCFQAFAYKGKTDAERRFIESTNKRRKKRIRKRHNEAVYGCRHMILVTMRKRPCLWVYHICPNVYPQFLSARMFCINFCQMILFCLAVMVWTPCIACCEGCRALICCMFCTQ